MLSKPATTVAAAAGSGCYGNMASSSSCVSPLLQDVRSRVDVKQTNGMMSSRGGHGRHHTRHHMASQPGYMQMTRAASVRWVTAAPHVPGPDRCFFGPTWRGPFSV